MYEVVEFLCYELSYFQTFFLRRKEAKLFVLSGNFKTNVLVHKICHEKIMYKLFSVLYYYHLKEYQ